MLLPVFVMGMLGGLQVLRANNNTDALGSPNISIKLLPTLLPLSLGFAYKNLLTNGRLQAIWARAVDFNACLYIGLVCALSWLQFTIVNSHGYLAPGTLSNPKISVMLPLLRNNGLFYELLLVPAELTILIGLCMEDRYSLTSKVLRTKFLQFVGRITLNLYLLYFPYQWIIEAIFLDYLRSGLHQAIVVRLMIFVTLPVWAFIVQICFVEPIGNRLRKCLILS